jgi:hypothetical protein
MYFPAPTRGKMQAVIAELLHGIDRGFPPSVP